MTLDGDRIDGRELRGHGLRDLDGLGLDDDRGAQGQDARARPRRCSSASTTLVTAPPDQARQRAAPSSASWPCSRACREFPVRVKCATLRLAHARRPPWTEGGTVEHGVTRMSIARSHARSSRDIEVTAIPYGETGAAARRARTLIVMQALGGSFTAMIGPGLHGPHRGHGRRRHRRGGAAGADARPSSPTQDRWRPRAGTSSAPATTPRSRSTSWTSASCTAARSRRCPTRRQQGDGALHPHRARLRHGRHPASRTSSRSCWRCPGVRRSTCRSCSTRRGTRADDVRRRPPAAGADVKAR